MREHVAAAREQLGAVARDARVDVALFGVNRLRFGQVVAVGAGQDAVDRVGEVDRGRARLADPLRGVREGIAGMQFRREGYAVGAKIPIAGAPRTARV